MLVPLKYSQTPSRAGTDDSTLTPGAVTSGFSRVESGVGPADEKPAIVGPDWVSAPTMIARLEVPGEVIEPAPGRDGAASATRQLCSMIRRQEIAKGVVFAQDGSVPACVANKHAGVRAALGANTAMVEEACRELGINVLVIEYPLQTPFQMKEMIARFMAAPSGARKEVAAMIETIEQGDGRADG